MKVTFKVLEEEGTNHLPIITAKLNELLNLTKAENPRGFLDQFESQFDGHCMDIAQELGAEFDIVDNEYVFKFLSGVRHRYNVPMFSH